MMIIIAFLTLIISLSLLSIIDRKIKGNKSILNKIASLIVVGGFLYLSVYFYGRQILDTFNVNAKSFTNVKLFFNSRVIALIAVLLLFLSFVFKSVLISIEIRTNNIVLFSKREITIYFALIVLDLFVVPNILSTLLLTLFLIGLAVNKLVFSNSFIRNKEVLA